MVKTLKGKIFLVNFSLVLIIAVVGSLSVLNLYKSGENVNGLMTDNYKSINAVNNMLEALERQNSAMLLYMNGDRQKGMAMFGENSAAFKGWYGLAGENITEPGEKERIERIGHSYESFSASFSQLRETYDIEGVEKASLYYSSRIMPDFVELKLEIRDLLSINEQSMFDKKESVNQSTRQSMNLLIVFTCAAVTGSVLFSRFAANKLLTPVYTLTEAIKSIKAGDLNKQIAFSSRDEIGVLAEEFNKMTKRLYQSEQSFSATISHEFKTPLTSMTMGTSMMLEEGLGPLNAEQKSIMEAIREDETRLTNLVNELLEFSRLESDKEIYDIKPCSISEIIRAVIKQFYETARENGVRLYCVLEDNMPRVNADFEKITWVLNNLVTNALKYTPPGGEISLLANAAGAKAYISVKDTGIGIPPEFQEKIFDQFVQVTGQDREERGTGLGLAIVKDIIAAHGTDIWCTSELKEGSTFTFTLPLYKEDSR